MNQLLDQALKAVSELPESEQNKIARLILDLARPEQAPEQLHPDHVASVLRGLEQAKNGMFSSDAEVEEALQRFEA